MIVGLYFLFLINDALSSDLERVIVNTNRGPISGRKGDGEFTTYYGVPYAKIDDENPFGNCLDYPHFDAPFDASNYTLKCPQVTGEESVKIQCLNIYLTLDIYVPKLNNTDQRIPVIVWFYGGSFLVGSSDYSGGKYMIKHNIIAVTVNYRFGPYGFLCLDDASVPGNQGLKDQIAALRWIKENIGAFGGDASKVTIAGQSYGGSSVDLQLYSTYEKLFDKVIIQSGLMFNEDMFVKGDYEAAIKLSKQLGYNPAHTKDALNFLIKADPLQVIMAATNISLQLKPCKEKHFKGVQSFFSNDLYAEQSAKVKDLSIMIGYNSREDYDRFMNTPDELYANFSGIFHEDLENNFALRRHELDTLSRIVRNFYLGGKSISKESMLELSDFSADNKVNHPVERTVNRYVKQGAGKIYKYLFSYVGGSRFKDIPGVGASHTEELQYLFHMIVKLNSDEQKTMRNRMTEMWANFVKYGDPTPEETELLPTKWIPVTNGMARPYLDINVEMTMLDHVYHERMAFWDLLWHHSRRKSVEKKRRRQK